MKEHTTFKCLIYFHFSLFICSFLYCNYTWLFCLTTGMLFLQVMNSKNWQKHKTAKHLWGKAESRCQMPVQKKIGKNSRYVEGYCCVTKVGELGHFKPLPRPPEPASSTMQHCPHTTMVIILLENFLCPHLDLDHRQNLFGWVACHTFHPSEQNSSKFVDNFFSYCGNRQTHWQKHTLLGAPVCASGCVVECQICKGEVTGSNLSRGYFAPRSTQPSIPPGSVNEYRL